jgi:hypothetical protein
MEKHTDAISFAISVLNSALKADPAAINYLVNARVMCNKELAEHPTIQVGKDSRYKGEVHWVGLLGIINGLFGIDDEGWGFIEGYIDDETGLVTGFGDRRERQVNS